MEGKEWRGLDWRKEQCRIGEDKRVDETKTREERMANEKVKDWRNTMNQ